MKDGKEKKDKKIPSPRKMTAIVKAKLLHSIKIGMSYDRAAVASGICARTFLSWRNLAEQSNGKGVYFELMRELKKAETDGELHNLEIISKAAENDSKAIETKRVYRFDENGKKTLVEETIIEKPIPNLWQPAAWKLERRHPERWGKKPVEVKTTNNIAINKVAQKVDLSDFSKEELDIIRKMSDEKDTEEVKSLSDIESEYYES